MSSGNKIEKKNIKILAIETSCDETSIAIIEKIEKGYLVLAHETISQVNKHIEFGGVFPTLAKREHQINLPVILERCLKKAEIINPETEINYMAVTNGPGLPPALWVGVTFAKELSVKLGNVPIYPINHMEGHIVAALSENTGEYIVIKQPGFPQLSLLISGGHTEFVLSSEPQVYEKIGETMDDAVGECFDKVARMLELPYPGGPEIGKLAKRGREEAVKYDFKFPRPMLHSKDLNFSFSGLKTSILYFIRDLTSPLDENLKIQIATEFEYTVRDVLFFKSKKAIEQTGAKSFVVGGGVISSSFLREELLKLENVTGCKVYLSDKQMATDNALMIALVAATQIENKKSPSQDFIAIGSKNYNWE